MSIPNIPVSKSATTFWLLLIATVGVLLAENLLTFKLSVPYMSGLSGGLPLLDMRFGYSTFDVYELFDKLGAAGREAYRQLFLSIDILIPLLISSFLWTAVTRGALGKWRLLALAGGAFDYLENVAILILLANYPQRLNATVTVAAIFTFLKFFFYGVGVALAIAGYVLSRRPARR